MRVLVVSHYALPHLGGIEILADQLASELLRRGHDVTHVASAAGRRTETGTAEAPQREHRVVRVPALNFPESRFGVPYPIFGPSLVGTLRREVSRADVVHAHGCLYPGSLTALALAARNDVRTVLTEHVGHVPYDNRLFDAVEASALSTLGRWSLRRADSVIVFNANVRELVAHLAPLAMVRWIDNGIDTDLFRPPEPGERARLRVELGWDDKPRVLFVGRAVAKKGFSTALDALREGGGAFELAVAGHEVAAPGPGLESLGPIPRERLASVYRAADALLAPSRGEGLPIAVQEALASGLPVVASDDPGYRETLREAGQAVTLMTPDGAEMGRALAERFRDRSNAAPVAEAVDFARRRFSVQRWTDDHERLYEELTAR